MDQYPTRDEALEAMCVRREATEKVRPPASRTPDVPVDDLIPFVHVHDVARSIAFYELLGFEVGDTHGPEDRPEWAALQSEDATIMFARADETIDARDQAVLFYLYSHDLHALQTHLRACGEQAGPIRDGSPGPRAEMRVADPDGNVLVIAQRDDRDPEADTKLMTWLVALALPLAVIAASVRVRRYSATHLTAEVTIAGRGLYFSRTEDRVWSACGGGSGCAAWPARALRGPARCWRSRTTLTARSWPLLYSRRAGPATLIAASCSHQNFLM